MRNGVGAALSLGSGLREASWDSVNNLGHEHSQVETAKLSESTVPNAVPET